MSALVSPHKTLKFIVSFVDLGGDTAKTKDQQTNENGEREREKAGAPMITY